MREDALVTFLAFAYVEELARFGVPIVACCAFVTAVLQVVEADWSVRFARRALPCFGLCSSLSR